MNKSTKTSLTYQDAGVNIDEGNRLVELIKPLAKKTHRGELIGGLGGLGLFVAFLNHIKIQCLYQVLMVSARN